MKLSLKFTLCFLLGMGVVQVVFSYLRVGREVALFDEDFRNDHESMGRDLAAAVKRVWELGGERAAIAFIDETNANKSQLMIQWIPSNESVASDFEHVIHKDELREQAKNDRVAFHRVSVDGTSSLRTLIPVVGGDRWLGTLVLTESFEKADRYVRASVIRSVVKDSIIIALTGTVGLILGLILVGRPVRGLVDRTRKLAAGNLSDPIVLRQSDELGDLAREINTMCDQLAEANRRVAEEAEARVAAIEQLRHADRLRTVGQLTSGIAHELGTPLNVVWERAKMIARDAECPAPSANSARIITEQSARMTAIIRQLLDFSRPSRPRKAEIDIRQVIRRTLNLLQSTFNSRGVSVDIREPEQPVLVELDVDQLQQVASNLLMNAVDAMNDGGQIQLEVGMRRARNPSKPDVQPRDYVFFSIRDQGRGIPPDELPRVFDPFFTTKDVGKGTGLGLSISLGIIQEHGGWITAESESGRGACFTAYLPIEDAPCPAVC